MCSLLKAFHVPIASYKVHYIRMESEEGEGNTPKGHKDCFGQKNIFFFQLPFGS